jgi:hypothetical protein
LRKGIQAWPERSFGRNFAREPEIAKQRELEDGAKKALSLGLLSLPQLYKPHAVSAQAFFREHERVRLWWWY